MGSRSRNWDSIEELAREDVFDSRDVVELIEELESELPAPDNADAREEPPKDAPHGYSVEGEAVDAQDAEGGEPTDVYRWTNPGGKQSTKLFATRAEAWEDAARVAEDDGWEDDRKFLMDLLALQDDQGAADWHHGETFIRESHFEKYAQELADDIGAIPKDAAWPCTCIDWEQAANELKHDYSAIEIADTTFYYRS